MTYTDTHTSFHALPADVRERVEARVGKPPRPMSTMQIMLAIGQEIVAERERCAGICTGWLDNFCGTQIKYTSAENYASDAVRDIRDIIRAGTPAGETE